MAKLSKAAALRDVEIWSYSGSSENAPAGTRFLKHRWLGHIVELLRRGRNARITDSTHFHLEYPHWLLLPLWLAARSILRFRWIKIVHDGSLPFRFSSFGAIKKILFGLGLRRIDKIVVVSPDLVEFIRSAGYIGPVECIAALLPNGEDSLEAEIPEDIAKKLERLSLREKKVCSVGAFIPSYGFHNVAEAVEELRSETRRDIGLVLIAGSFAGEAEYRSSVLRDRAWIEIVEDVPQPLAMSIMEKCDVFVRAFQHESLGLSRIEALWSGLPVIATDIGETRGMLTYEFNDTGRLKELLKAVLNGDAEIDSDKWAAVFHNEAELNLASYIRVVLGD